MEFFYMSKRPIGAEYRKQFYLLLTNIIGRPLTEDEHKATRTILKAYVNAVTELHQKKTMQLGLELERLKRSK